MSLINHDHAHTTWPKEPVWVDEKKSESLIVRVAVAIIIIMGIATIYAVCSNPAFGEPSSSVVGATTDNLLGEEMAEFIVRHPGHYDEGDIE